MKKRRLFWTIFPGILLLSIGTLILVAWLATSQIRDFYISELQTDLLSRAKLVEQCLPSDSRTRMHLDPWAKDLKAQSDCRITLVAKSGKVFADSDEQPATMENHADRPEIRAALENGEGTSIRYSPTLDTPLMYRAIKSSLADGTPIVLRVSLPMTAVESALNSVRSRIAFTGLVIAILAIIASFILTLRIARPIEDIRKGADIIASGNFEHTLASHNTSELANLTESINRMSNELRKRLQQVTLQRNELEAVLESMVEGVIVLDSEQRITRVNQAVVKQFGLDSNVTDGKLIEEVFRVAPLQQLVADTFRTDKPLEREIALTSKDKIFYGHSALIQTSTGEQIGALVVLHDVTSMKKLEAIRREFVANVSHELRTPLTSVKGYIETLQDGAIDDPDNARKFIDITAHHIDKLNAIIDDLLDLARIEAASGRGNIELKETEALDLLKDVVEVQQPAIEAKGIIVKIDCSPEVTLKMNRQLMEHAVGNLLENAVRYSDENGEIIVSASKTDGKTVISVKDFGQGIAPEHHARLFERFYRVAKDRNAADGGTGLGLALVKHIAIVHDGAVEVDSAPGKGSEFRIVV